MRRGAWRWARVSTASGSGSMPACPASKASIRAHRRGQSLRGKTNWRPRLSRVIWRTCLPERSEVTRRKVTLDSLADLFRVAVLRMNMVGRWGWRRGRSMGSLQYYGTTRFFEIYWRFSWGFREFVTVGGGKSVKDGVRMGKDHGGRPEPRNCQTTAMRSCRGLGDPGYVHFADTDILWQMN